jgi:hypothetical protein
VIKNLINIFLLSSPKIKLIVLKIIQNLIRIHFPIELFEEGINALMKDEKSTLAHRIINSSQYEFEGSRFLQFFYNYLIQTRSKVWSQSGVENEGTYAVTSEIVRFLRFITENAPQEEFRSAARNKMSTFLSQPIEKWSFD